MIKETKTENPLPYEPVPPAVSDKISMKLSRNVAFLMLMMLCLSSIYNEQLPDGQTVLTAVQQTVDGEWDEHLGKITFVDGLIPDSIAVFFAQPGNEELLLPCLGTMNHAWSQESPYLSFTPENNAALAIADGEVMAIAHTADDALSLRIRHDNGLESVYYQLEEVFCREGDVVKSGDTLATIRQGQLLLLDVRRDGLSIDPTAYFKP